MTTTPAQELAAAAGKLRELAAATPAAMHPGVGAALADLLDFEVDLVRRVPGSELRGRTALLLAMARLINGPAGGA